MVEEGRGRFRPLEELDTEREREWEDDILHE